MTAADDWVLGVDHGVVNTAAALCEPGGHASELWLSDAGPLMPSAVFWGDQQVLVGRRAIEAGASCPAALEPHPKLAMSDAGRHGPGAYAQELIAAVLADVLERSRAVTGDGFPDQLVLTYPDVGPTSVWESAQVRDGLQQAADLLVCRRCALIPVSAAITTFIDHEPQYIAPVVVVNFGATHCDAVICTRQYDGTYAPVASRRVDGLGAFTVEARVREWLSRSVRARSSATLATLDWPDRLDVGIREAISALSATESATIEPDVGGDDPPLRLSRDLFDVLTRGYVNAVVGLTREMVAAAHGLTRLPAPPVIVLTGSAGRNPTIRSRIAELGFVAELGDPATLIARGAAYHGARLDEPPRPVEAARRWAPAPRLLVEATHEGRPCKRSLVPESEHRLEVRLGPAPDDPAPDDQALDDQAPDDQAPELLVDVFSEDGSVHRTAPLVGPTADPSAAGPGAAVTFVSGPEGSTLRLHITVLHRGRPLQAGLLVASVRAKAAVRDRIRLLPAAVSGPLKTTTKADATVEQTDATLTRLGTPDSLEIPLSAVTDIAQQIERSASKMVRADGAACTSTDPTAVRLLIDLAGHGSRLAEKLTDLGLADAGIIAVTARHSPTVPLELAYDGPAPDPTAQLCGCMPGRSTDPAGHTSHATRQTVCPCAFWGVNRIITRSIIGRPVKRRPLRRAPLSLRPVLYAAADEADAASPPWESPATELEQALIRHAGPGRCIRVSSWRGWRRAVRRAKPELLVILGHAEMPGREPNGREPNGREPNGREPNGREPNLVIGRTSRLARSSVSPRELAATDAPAPLVLLFGCATGLTEDDAAAPVDAFLDAGAAAVVAPLTNVGGADAAQAAAAVVAAMRSDRPPGLTVAEAVTQARRRLIGQGLPVGLVLLAHGDADIKGAAW